MRVGRYELTGARLGEGGYAKVVLGRDIETGEQVAVKLLDTRASKEKAASSEASIIREVAAMRRACVSGHPNVAKLHAYQRLDESRHAVVLELCRGGEMFRLVERHGALPEGKVRPLFAGVVAGVRHLHAAGVAHRDLKLENILLGGDGCNVPKIVDLGLAHVHAHASAGEPGAWAKTNALTQFCGSRSYCAPEVMARLGYDGFVADIWSLGVCLFGLVAGFFPVDEASARDWRFERVARLQHLEPTRSTTRAIFAFYGRECPLSNSLIELLDGMLQAQPSKRISLAAISASAWLAGSAPPAKAAFSASAPQPIPQPMGEVIVDIERSAPAAGAPATGERPVDVSETLYRAAPLAAAPGEEVYRASADAPREPPPMLTRQRAYTLVGSGP